MRISYMGIPFSNSEEAANKFASSMGWNDVELVPAMTAEGVVASISSGESDYGVVAYSNITAGKVIETEIALKGRNNIVKISTDTVPIHHCIFTKNKDSKIRKISSHIQALLQTKNSLDRLYPGTERVEVEDTAYAAEMLADGRLQNDTAVVCRKNAGDHYGLFMAHENVEDRKDNMTTFILIKIV